MTTEPGTQAAAPEAAGATPARKASSLRWLAWGTGAAIEIRATELLVAAVRVRPSGAALLGAARIPDYRTRPAVEWGAEVTSFLRKLGAGHVAVTALLPRSEVIVRVISLPGVAASDTEAAIRLQLDSLHPFSDEDAVFSFARLGKTGDVLVGIARRETVDAWSTLFAEAGIKTAAFTFSAAAVYSAARLLNTPASNFVTACRAEDDIEIYGESESRPLYTATLPVAPERALAIGRSELRLEPETPAVPVTEVLPAAVSAPESIEVASMPFLWAAALYGACPHRGIEANLLPPERRRGSSRLRLVPTFALGIALAVLLVLLALQSSQADKRYLGVLQHEVSRFEPVARRSEALDRAITSARAHSESLDSFRRRTRLDMDALAETTKLIPPPGWLTHLDMDRNTVTVAGEMDGAAGLLKTFDSSPQFERTEFTMPISRTGSSDLFRIRTNRQTPGAATPSAPPQTQGATK